MKAVTIWAAWPHVLVYDEETYSEDEALKVLAVHLHLEHVLATVLSSPISVNIWGQMPGMIRINISNDGPHEGGEAFSHQRLPIGRIPGELRIAGCLAPWGRLEAQWLMW